MTETILIAFSKHEFKELIKGTIQEAMSEQTNSSKGKTFQSHEYLSIDEATIYLQLPKNTLYNYCHNNVIPYHKRGKRNYFLKADLDVWMASNRKKSGREIQEEALTKLKKGGVRRLIYLP